MAVVEMPEFTSSEKRDYSLVTVMQFRQPKNVVKCFAVDKAY